MQQLDQNFGVLSDEDCRRLDAEHARLDRFLHDLRDTCENYRASGDCFSCSKAQVATCQGRLVSFFYDFLDLVGEHFENEESIMAYHLAQTPHEEYLRQHHDAHASLERKIRELMRASALFSHQGNPSQAIRLLYDEIAQIFGEHAREYDDAFLQTLELQFK